MLARIGLGAHRKALEFTAEQHKELKKICVDQDIIYSSYVWDLTSAIEISSIKPESIQIPSTTNLDFEMQKYLCENFRGKIYLSIGMTSNKERADILHFYESEKRIDGLVLYCCASGYPINFDEICLLEIRKLQDLLRGTQADVGFSGHHLGIAPDIAAVTLGVKWLERHFTLDGT